MLESIDCFHNVNDFINLGGAWYPFCSECKKVVEVEQPQEHSSIERIITEAVDRRFREWVASEHPTSQKAST